jgi:hypothetical protein
MALDGNYGQQLGDYVVTRDEKPISPLFEASELALAWVRENLAPNSRGIEMWQWLGGKWHPVVFSFSSSTRVKTRAGRAVV